MAGVCLGGCLPKGGDVCPGVRGVSAHRGKPRGVSAQGRGVYLGGSAQRGCLPPVDKILDTCL